MQVELTEPQRQLRDTVRAFAEARIKPVAAEHDRTGRFPREIMTGLGELGALGVFVPEAYGGAGFDHVSYALAVEEVSAAFAQGNRLQQLRGPLSRYVEIDTNVPLRPKSEEWYRHNLPAATPMFSTMTYAAALDIVAEGLATARRATSTVAWRTVSVTVATFDCRWPSLAR